jgi:HK97 gp10 family phage protein
MNDIHITGLSELNEALQTLPAKIEANILRGALRFGQNVIKNVAKARCPVGEPSAQAKKYGAYPGALRDSIRVSARSSKGTVTVKVTAGNKIAYYAHMAEFGTRPHAELPSGAKALFVAGRFKMQVQHPGAIAKPFMRPAFDNHAHAAIQAAADYMAERIPIELAKK